VTEIEGALISDIRLSIGGAATGPCPTAATR
jgi:hypothetical protein